MSEGAAPSATDARIMDLLAPIAVANPTGRSIRYEPDYALIEDARREENAALPQGIWERDVKRADWATVERLCTDALIQRSKDLRVACWLAEAWLQREGIAGLTRGLLLLDQLSRRFWPDLHPAIPEGDLGARLAPLEWLNRRVPVVINLLPLVFDPSQPERAYSWSTYLEAQRLEHVRQQDAGAAQRAEAKGAVTLTQFTECQQQTDSEVFREFLAAARAARTRLGELEATLTGLCGRDAPGLGRIRTVLLDLEAFVDGALRERVDAEVDPPPRLPPPAAATTPRPPAPQPAPMSRDIAYRELARIADVLAALEPHSPVPLVLRELLAWGGLTLPELQERLNDAGSDVSVLLQVLGLHAD